MNILKKYSIQLIARALVLVAGLVTSRWLVANLSPSHYQLYSLSADFISNLAITCITFSIPSVIYRYYSNHHFNEENSKEFNTYWSTFFYFRLITFFIGLGIVAITVVLLKIENWFIPFIIYLAQFFLLTDSSYKSVCDAIDKSWLFGITDATSKILIVILLYCSSYIFLGNVSIYLFVFILATGYFFGLIADFFIHKKYTTLVKPDFSIIKKSKKSILQFSVIALLSFFYLSAFQMTMYILKLNQYETNAFTNSYSRIFFTIYTFPSILIPNIATKIKQAVERKDKQTLKRKVLELVGITVFSQLALLIGGPIIIKLIDPQNKYPLTMEYLLTMSPLMMVYVLLAFFYAFSTLHHKERQDMHITIILFIVSIPLQFILGYYLGAKGILYSFIIVSVLDFILKITLFTKIVAKYKNN